MRRPDVSLVEHSALVREVRDAVTPTPVAERVVAATLLRCGARATINEAGAPTGASALGIAAMRLDVPMIELLLQSGADPSALDADHLTARDRLPALTSENARARAEAELLLRR